MEMIKKAMPEPKIFGVQKDADISFVGWGSSVNVMRDVVREMAEKGVKVNYIHYSHVWPLKVKKLEKFYKENKNVHILEGNYRSQFANLIHMHSAAVRFKNHLVKWNGRPFYVEELEKYIDKHTK